MANKIVEKIKNRASSIYEPLDNALFIPTQELESILNHALKNLNLAEYALRTRSKVVKAKICEALGYSIPKSFKKCQPRFPAQNFDTYVQKSLNVQIWNEAIDPNRRYVFIRTNDDSVVTTVRIINGEQLAQLDKTGTLTQKYQATMKHFGSKLFTDTDTVNVDDWLSSCNPDLSDIKPIANPTKGKMLPIKEIFIRLMPLVGSNISHLGNVQERNRGSELHSKICKQLGYSDYADDGQYPDIVHQLIEVKLQTSPTIDLGMHSPEDGATVIRSENKAFKSEDIRYVVFDGSVHENKVHLDALYVVNGENFTKAFPLFQGKVQNKKLQIPLPKDFFD